MRDKNGDSKGKGEEKCSCGDWCQDYSDTRADGKYIATPTSGHVYTDKDVNLRLLLSNTVHGVSERRVIIAQVLGENTDRSDGETWLGLPCDPSKKEEEAQQLKEEGSDLETRHIDDHEKEEFRRPYDVKSLWLICPASACFVLLML
ncbi:hypothetical protein Bca4012_070232 [Brassica carinata]|uniref:Uncharacterized protein n=1 Tax=Brassica carinata TaxID=52824 RepID=A0A8X7QFL8_BRACI|nr:hypothetical protein Bca52824_062330 [Brassica carinata]